MANSRNTTKEPADTLYVGFCRVCDEDVVFRASSTGSFVCPKCRNEMQLKSGGRPSIVQA